MPSYDRTVHIRGNFLDSVRRLLVFCGFVDPERRSGGANPPWGVRAPEWPAAMLQEPEANALFS